MASRSLLAGVSGDRATCGEDPFRQTQIEIEMEAKRYKFYLYEMGCDEERFRSDEDRAKNGLRHEMQMGVLVWRRRKEGEGRG